MIEFKDEILNGEPRYRVRDIDGNLIHDNAAIEMSTPVVQQGTPLNKPFFENIQAYIQSVDRYNQTTLTKSTDYTVEYHKDIFPNTWQSLGEGVYTSEGITISAITNYPNSTTQLNPVYYAFDGDLSTYIEMEADYGGKQLSIDMGKPIKIKEAMAKIGIYYDAGTIDFQGSTDNSTWNTLYSWGYAAEDDGDKKHEMVISTPEFYRYYRFYINGSYSAFTLYEFRTTKYEVAEAQIINSNLRLDKYDTNKTIKIITPEEFDTTAQTSYININNLGDKPIKGKMYAGSKYTLYYNGDEFSVTPEEIDTSTKNVYLEITDNGGTQKKYMKFNVGNAKMIALSFYGSWSVGTTLSGFILIDIEKSKKLFGIGNRRYVKYENTNSATSNLLVDETTQPISMSTELDSTTDLALYNYYDTYGRQDYGYVEVKNISYANGILTVPVTLYTNGRLQEQTATIYGFANIIN